MRPRDLAIVAAVLLVGGFAAADALRGDAEPPAREALPTGPSSAPEETTTERVETIRSARPGVLAGRLLFSDEACRVRELDLRSGRLAPYATVQSTCSLIAPSGGDAPLSAVALPSPRRDVLPYRVVDLERSDPHVLSFRARSRSVVWSRDGRRVAWCEPTGRGQEVVLGSEPRFLPGCPIAYTPEGDPVYARGRAVLVGGRELLQASGSIEAISFTREGSVAVAAGGTRLAFYTTSEAAGLHLEREVVLLAGMRHLRTVFSPTHCHAALLSGEFPPSPTVFVVDLRPCPGSRAPATFSGRAAAWSPDGRWLAVAERRRVVAQPLFEGEPAVALRITATDLAWRP
jgi:WD40-like Beta Propeller Repeat